MQGSKKRSVTDKCAQDFSTATRSKGATYHRSGRVALQSFDEGRIEAKVRGTAGFHYEVRIDAEDPRDGIFAACSCPYFDGGNLCKHIWATLLEAEEEGQLRGLGSIPNIDVFDEPSLLDGLFSYDNEYDEDFDDEPYYDEYRPRYDKRSALNSLTRKKSSTSRSTDWQRALKSVPDASIGRPHPLSRVVKQERKVHYMLDVSASITAGSVIVELMQQEKRKDGEWGKIKRLPLSLASQCSQEDQDLIAQLVGNRMATKDYYGHYLWDSNATSGVCIGITSAGHSLLPLLCATGRFQWVLTTDLPEDSRPITWDNGPAWRPRLRVEGNDKKKQWTITGEIYREKEVRPLSDVVAPFPPLLLFADQIAMIEPIGNYRWLDLLQAQGSVVVPYSQRREFLESLWQEGSPNAIWPKNLTPNVQPAIPQGRLRVHKQKKEGWGYQPNRNILFADGEFLYDGTAIAIDDPRSGIVLPDGETILQRNDQREAELLEQLRELSITSAEVPNYYRPPGKLQLPIKKFDEVVSTLVARGWQVEAEGANIRTAGKFSLSVRASGVDWFELESQIDFGGEYATLPELLAAVRAGENYVKLGDGSRGMLPDQWLKRFAPLVDLAEQKDGKLRFKPAQSLLLDALLSEKNDQMQVELDRHFKQFRQKLQKFSGVKPKKAPRTFKGELRPYQENGVGWLKFLEEFNLGGCLADDMGLGKTIQVLAWLLARRQPNKKTKPTLIVVPKSLIFNWIEEAGRFAPVLKTLNYTGLDRSERAADFSQADMVLTTYGTLRRDIAKLKDQRFDCVILDEAQAIKNDASQTAKACRLLDADLRLALTGTPIENHLGELWSLFEFLNPGMLGRSAAFRTFCQQADEKPESRELLQRGLAPFILRRTKQQVLKDLPEKTEQTIHCELSPAERKKYNELRDYYRASLQKRIDSDGMNKSKMHVLEALLRLRQAACHPGLLDKKLATKSSAKLDVLMEQIGEITQEGHKALIFSQFTTLLSIVKQQLDKQGIVYEYLDGKTRNRQERVDRFQTDTTCPLFLISLKAGGCGLNLTAADYVFLLDPWWNPAVEAQAIDRTHRIGQTRNVFAYRLIAQDTVEEKILELQQQKSDLADAIISSNANLLSKLTAEDLQVLLS